MNHKYQLKMLVQNMTQVKPRSPAITQRLLEHDLTRLNGLTIIPVRSVVMKIGSRLYNDYVLIVNNADP